MATLWYRDPVDQQFKPFATPEPKQVAVGTQEPADPAILIWIDEASNYP
jgi:hypothetical protein